jgi:hypothetical protein
MKWEPKPEVQQLLHECKSDEEQKFVWDTLIRDPKVKNLDTPVAVAVTEFKLKKRRSESERSFPAGGRVEHSPDQGSISLKSKKPVS